MKSVTTLTLCALLFTLAGCAGTLGSNPAPAADSFSSSARAAAASQNIAGKFSGTIDDTVHGHGDAVFELTQTGNNPGGSLREDFRAKHLRVVVALHIDNTESVTGSAVMPLDNQPCSFEVVGHYVPDTFVLTGRLKASHNCGKEVGLFTVKEDCYYSVKQAAADRIKPSTVPKAC